ncbi:hypothetical protein K435DRAFT_204860 [Dendrothele bispora CBS 962.96]|uniref:Uncharacterized protein n=1 Tax=Dendrothele bispora (strain CBS 962.96) TaxID=1314807 RepID=A0A4S8LTB1_DENBC|nr:hypothetical protein K435DRAFT_204860 [Dendrothele bispora CBS 962.96]
MIFTKTQPHPPIITSTLNPPMTAIASPASLPLPALPLPLPLPLLLLLLLSVTFTPLPSLYSHHTPL